MISHTLGIWELVSTKYVVHLVNCKDMRDFIFYKFQLKIKQELFCLFNFFAYGSLDRI